LRFDFEKCKNEKEKKPEMWKICKVKVLALFVGANKVRINCDM
jgi:hypothetical protein